TYTSRPRTPLPTPPPTLFPYTTLFRSTASITYHHNESGFCSPAAVPPSVAEVPLAVFCHKLRLSGGAGARLDSCRSAFTATSSRSEEHTSELQSRVDLVCRLLLEKKKI